MKFLKRFACHRRRGVGEGSTRRLNSVRYTFCRPAVACGTRNVVQPVAGFSFLVIGIASQSSGATGSGRGHSPYARLLQSWSGRIRPPASSVVRVQQEPKQQNDSNRHSATYRCHVRATSGGDITGRDYRTTVSQQSSSPVAGSSASEPDTGHLSLYRVPFLADASHLAVGSIASVSVVLDYPCVPSLPFQQPDLHHTDK